MNGAGTSIGTADGNSVIIMSGRVLGAANTNPLTGVVGAMTDLGAATNNTVSIQGDARTLNAIGATSGAGAVTGNSVTIADDATVDTYVIGGFNHGGRDANGDLNTSAVSGNSVTISTTGTVGTAASGLYLTHGVIGGFHFGNGAVTDNTVTITSGDFGFVGPSNGYVAGGLGGDTNNVGNGEVRNNSVTVTGGTFESLNIFGGRSFGEGLVSSNSVSMTGDTVTVNNSWIVGGIARNGDSRNNRITLGAIEITNNDDIDGGFSSNGNTESNIVTLTGTTISGGNNVNGGWSNNGNANTNEVHMTDATLDDINIVGGYAAGAGNANGNIITLTGITLTPGMWGNYINGGYTNEGSSNNNTVTVVSSTLSGWVVGGETAAWTPGQTANNNTVTIDGGADGTTTTSFVAGGVVWSDGNKAQNNTVNLIGNITFHQVTSSIYGGTDLFSGGAVTNLEDITLGNTLNVTSQGNEYTVNEVSNFQTVNFGLGRPDAGKTVFRNGTAFVTDGVQVNVGGQGGVAPLAAGQSVTLFNVTDGEGGITLNTTGEHGALFDYTLQERVGDNDSYGVTVRNTRGSDESQLFGQGQLAGMQMVNAASDLARNVATLFSVAESCNNPCDTTNKPVIFAGLEGGTSRWNSGNGSRTTLDHINLITGLGYRAGNFLFAGFLEAGWGQYDAKLSGRKYVDGEDTSYIGGGALARYEANGFYGEAGFHAGKVKADFNATLRQNSAVLVNGIRSSYELDSTYYGIDAVLGYQKALTASLIDVAVRYSWNRVKGDDGRAGLDAFSLDNVDSHRIRAGGTYRYNGFGNVSPYVGAHFEYEFDAKAHASAYGYNLREAKMRGASGIGELGVRIGGNASRFTADIGIEGYVGKRRGVTGKALFGWAFLVQNSSIKRHSTADLHSWRSADFLCNGY